MLLWLSLWPGGHDDGCTQPDYTGMDPCILGIPIQKSKIHLNMEPLSIDCRNKHWPQCFNRILISSAGSTSICSAVVVQAALESRAACTTTAGHIEVEPADEIKIRFKHCGQCLFLQSMLSASIFKWIFDFWIGIPNVGEGRRTFLKLSYQTAHSKLSLSLSKKNGLTFSYRLIIILLQ